MFAFATMLFIFEFSTAVASKVCFHHSIGFEMFFRTLLDNSIILKICKNIDRCSQLLQRIIVLVYEKRLKFHDADEELMKMKSSFETRDSGEIFLQLNLI